MDQNKKSGLHAIEGGTSCSTNHQIRRSPLPLLRPTNPESISQSVNILWPRLPYRLPPSSRGAHSASHHATPAIFLPTRCPRRVLVPLFCSAGFCRRLEQTQSDAFTTKLGARIDCLAYPARTKCVSFRIDTRSFHQTAGRLLI
jgi:hypothetical protein